MSKKRAFKGCGQTSWQACWSLRLKWFITLFQNSNASSPRVVRTILRHLCWILSPWPFEFTVTTYKHAATLQAKHSHCVFAYLLSSTVLFCLNQNNPENWMEPLTQLSWLAQQNNTAWHVGWSHLKTKIAATLFMSFLCLLPFTHPIHNLQYAALPTV